MDNYSNTQYLFNNCAAEVKEPIKVLVLTDDETEIIKQERKDIRKEIKVFQIECRDFLCRTWYRVLNEKLEEQYNKKNGVKREETWFMSDGYYQAFLRKVDKIFYDKYGFYYRDILKGKTQSWAKTEEIHKRIQDYKKGLIPNPVLTSANRRFKKFYTKKGKLILDVDTPEEELTIRERNLKKNYEFNKEFLGRANKQIQREEKEKIHNQDLVTNKAYKIRKLQYYLDPEFNRRPEVIEPTPNDIRKMTKLFYEYDFMGALDDWEIGFNEDRLDRINPPWKVSDCEDAVNDLGVSESELFPNDDRGDSD